MSGEIGWYTLKASRYTVGDGSRLCSLASRTACLALYLRWYPYALRTGDLPSAEAEQKGQTRA